MFLGGNDKLSKSRDLSDISITWCSGEKTTKIQNVKSMWWVSEGLSWEVGIVAVHSQGLWWSSIVTVSAVQQGESPGPALLPRPPWLPWHCWATVAQVALSGVVSSCALAWVRWAGGMSSNHSELDTGSCIKAWCDPLCVYLLLSLS